MKVARFKSPDIHCEACAAAIKRSLGKLTGVAATSVDVGSREVLATFDESITSEETIAGRLEAAGFPPISSEVLEASDA